MQYGICTTMEYYGLLEETGADSITLAGKDLMAMSGEEFSAARKTLESGSVVCGDLNAFCTPKLRLNGPGFSLFAVQEYTKRLAERASAIGVERIGIGSGPARSVPETFSRERAMEQFQLFLRSACEIVGSYGIDILMESVCTRETNFVTTAAEAHTLVVEMGIPNLHLIYDSYHEERMGQTLAVVPSIVGQVAGIHVSQIVGEERCYLGDSYRDRCGEILAAFSALGYDGPVSVEAFDGDTKQGIRQSMEIFRHTIA